MDVGLPTTAATAARVAYAASPLLTGKASLGFGPRYRKGASLPSGNHIPVPRRELRLQHATYQWLVVAGAKAQFKGTGTVNGTGTYGFLLSAVDGQLNGGGGIDRFRIKIWDLATGGVVYDNQMGGADGSTASTALGGGSIVIHP